jgi:hypothetical protein
MAKINYQLSMKSILSYLSSSLAFALLLTSCGPPMDVYLRNDTAAKLACQAPRPSAPVKVFVRGQVEWNGKSASIANGYFTGRLKSTISKINGFTIVPEKEADLVVQVKRNNKYDISAMQRATNAVVRHEVAGTAVSNDYDHWFTITSPRGSWSGNVPHGLFFVMGDASAVKVDGFHYGYGDGQGKIASLVLADETMLSQVVVYALLQAQKAGCYK